MTFSTSLELIDEGTHKCDSHFSRLTVVQRDHHFYLHGVTDIMLQQGIPTVVGHFVSTYVSADHSVIIVVVMIDVT